MRSRVARLLTLTLLGSAVALSAASFGIRALACETMRMTEAERPACCDFGSKDRVTRDGGDCCKALWSAPSVSAAERAADHGVRRLELDLEGTQAQSALALAAWTPHFAIAPALWAHALADPQHQFARRPFDPVATTVLLN